MNELAQSIKHTFFERRAQSLQILSLREQCQEARRVIDWDHYERYFDANELMNNWNDSHVIVPHQF